MASFVDPSQLCGDDSGIHAPKIDHNSPYSDYVQKIIERLALVESHESPQKNASDMGPLLPQELDELTLLCRNQGFQTVECDPLRALVEALDQHVAMAIASAANLAQAAALVLREHEAPSAAAHAIDKWLRAGTGYHKMQKLRAGLKAASIVLYIVSFKSVDQASVVGEDALEAAITLYKMHLHQNLIPALNQIVPSVTQHTTDDSHTNKDISPSKKRKIGTNNNSSSNRNTTDHATIKHIKKVQQVIIHESMSLQLTLMNRITVLVERVPLDDQQIVNITSGAIETLQIDCHAVMQLGEAAMPQHLQLFCIEIVTAAFHRYPSFRETIMEDIFHVLPLLPTGKRSLRTYALRYASAQSPSTLSAYNESMLRDLLPNANLPHFIQMVTALVLSLVQSCAQTPTFHGNDIATDKYISGLAVCKLAANYFVEELLKRCMRPKNEGADFRPVWIHLVEDLCLSLMVPEFPGAELLLYTLMTRLLRLLTGQTKSLETTFLNTAFDIVGRICAVEGRLLAHARGDGMVPPTNSSAGGDVPKRCLCNKDTVEGLMITCNRCNVQSHGHCVGLTRVEDVPRTWVCDPCLLGEVGDRERTKYRVKGSNTFVSSTYTMRRMNLMTMLNVETDIHNATMYSVADWIDELYVQTGQYEGNPHAAVGSLIAWIQNRSKGDSLERQEFEGVDQTRLSDAGSVRVFLASISQTSPLLQKYRGQVTCIIELMGDKHPAAVRKLSLKAMEKSAEGDPDLMRMNVVTKAVSRRLMDDTISVREAAISLVGMFVVKFPQVADAFQGPLLSCLSDEGISVRKRAIRIFQAILSSNPKYKGRAVFCDAMLRRVADPREEDGVRDLINDLFEDLWFSSHGNRTTTLSLTPQSASSSIFPSPQDDDITVEEKAVSFASRGVVTPTPPAKEKRRLSACSKIPDITALQMMEVVRAGGSVEHLESLIKNLIGQNTDSDKARKDSDRKKRSSYNLKHCAEIVDALVKLLVDIESVRQDRRSSSGRELVASLQTLCVFANIVPHAVQNHLDTLIPYLKTDNGVSREDESSIVVAVCDAISRIAPRMDEHAKLRIQIVADDISKLVFGAVSSSALSSSVGALSALVLVGEVSKSDPFDTARIKLARRFFHFLHKKVDVKNFSMVDVKTRNNCHRALTMLGLICRHYESSGQVSLDAYYNHLPDDIDGSTLVIGCYAMFTKYLDKEDTETKCVALRALGGIFSCQPKLLLQLEENGVIEKVMSSHSPLALQLESLKCWSTILSEEEDRLERAALDTEYPFASITTTKKVAGDQNGDATLFGGIIGNHVGRVFEMVVSKEHSIRKSALDLLGILLRQGLINPNAAVPYLYALQGDNKSPDIRNLALKFLMIEGEKRPDALRQRICQGIKEAFSFQQKLSREQSEVTAVFRAKNGSFGTIFNEIFKECIAPSRKLRRGLYKTVLLFFEGNTDLQLLSFVSQILAYFPYTTADDPLYIIHHIREIVTVEGDKLLTAFADILRPVGLANMDNLDDSNAKEDVLEKAARRKFPSKTSEADPLGSEAFDVNEFTAKCRRATALVLLLRLKAFLCKVHCLSETRCLTYDPSSKDKLSDKCGFKADYCLAFDASITKSLLAKSKSIDLDSLIRQYSEFRSLMRDDASSDGVMDDDDSGDLDSKPVGGSKRKSFDTDTNQVTEE